MPGFKVHITASTALGVAYGTGAAVVYDVPLPACLLAGGLCSVSGMLPDLDSGPGVPLRESLSFAAAVVPMLMIDHLRAAGLAPESIVLVGAALYLGIRFGLGHVLRKWSVHRGMFHSIPALAVVGELTYFICAHENPWMRVFNAGAVMIGFGSHLILDEIWSIEFRHGLKFKSSFGTAIKFWGDCWWSNLIAYANVGVLAFLILGDPTLSPPAPTDAGESTVATQPFDNSLH